MIASSLASGVVVVVVALLLACLVVCAMKGKWGVVVMGLAASASRLGPVVAVVLLSLPIFATRLAKPGSFWARHWYDDDEITKADGRFPKSPALPRLPHAQDSEPLPDEDPRYRTG